MSDERYWFRAKQYGYGWGLPLTWEGWTVLGGYLAVVTVPLLFGEPAAYLSLGALVVGTPAFIAICSAKSEPARWRGARSQDS